MEANKDQCRRTKLLFQSCPERRVMRNKELMFERPFEAVRWGVPCRLGASSLGGHFPGAPDFPSSPHPRGKCMPVPKSDP